MKQFGSGRALARALRDNLKTIERTAARASLWSRKSRMLPKEMEWLLDNRYLCRREGAEALPVIENARRLPLDNKTPVVYKAAEDILTRCGNVITEEAIGAFLCPDIGKSLSENELWLFIPMLRAALIGRISACCTDIGSILSAYEKTTGDSPFTAEAKAFEARQSGRVPDPGTEDFAEAAGAAHRRGAERLGALITSLRLLSSADLTETLQNASAMEAELRRDPIYAQMDEETRSRYRAQLTRLARRAGISEREAAGRVLTLCSSANTKREQHVGTYLWDKPLGKNPPRWPGRLYFAVLTLLTALPAALCAHMTDRVWVGILLFLPFSAMAKNITDMAATRLAPCRPVPRLELPDGLPEDGKTLCVVSVLLSGHTRASDFASKLESYRYANRDAGENLLFGLLADLPDSSQKRKPSDERALSEVQQAVFALNRKHGGGFYLFSRDREWNVRDKSFMAWERKRGALLELCRLLRGKSSGLCVKTGDKTALGGVRFIIALDSDTVLTPGSARQMTGAMLHPCVRPAVDPARRVVTEGHGILAPRMAADLEAAGRTIFSRVFAGQGGIDPYSGMAGEVYHDLFGQGSFHGKGIFDVDAYLACLDGRFPENRILSHDLLEGNYLRAGLMEDVELTDGFPASARAWFLRQHRWIRGDWQVASWILPRVPMGASELEAPRRENRSLRGGSERNPTNALARWKLLDTLRSSLVPVATLAALTAGTLFPGRTFAVILAAALVSSASHLLLSLGERLTHPGTGREKTHAAIITGLPAVVSQTLLTLSFLPYHAALSAHAAWTAFWRVCVSKRNLLQWVTSADTERIDNEPVDMARKMFPGLAWGVLTAFLSRSPLGWVLGAGWAASPFIAHAVSRIPKPGAGLSDADRAFLTRQAALMWRYFEDFLSEEDHFLIPDNYQEQPAAGIAHRTSPTNVGLSLLCSLAAVDLGLCPEERALYLIERILTTLESIPKWHGHLLNWYDTRTLAPLTPRCVSSVDSGNLCGCLIALREGLLELEKKQPPAEDSSSGVPVLSLAARADSLAAAMDFRPLFDQRKKLFRICIDLDRPGADSGVYDLLASEARQTSYITVARGEVDKKHWRRLGRAHTALGRYRGMASWTGTMFEYFMPHLLLPAPRNSLIRESLDFAVYAQRAWAAKHGGCRLWGVSESCFYAFDRALNYQYKAHGVPALAYKRGMEGDWVVAPYASYLTLLTHPSASVRNLRRMIALGMEGAYGLIEAVDFTPSRTVASAAQNRESAGGAISGEQASIRHAGMRPVQCYMSHHLGMSIVAVCNALRENVMQKRFMRDGAMGAFAGLLQERVPVGTAVVRPAGREVPEKPKRLADTKYARVIERVSYDSPGVMLLGNGSYSVLCTDGGLTRSECGELSVTRFAPSQPEGGGLRFYFNGNSLFPLEGGCSSSELYGDCVMWKTSRSAFEAELSVAVPDNENAEQRSVTIKNTGTESLTGLLAVYFEPVIQRAADYTAHPAFSKLFIETVIPEAGLCLIRRRPRGGEQEVWLAFACDKENAHFETSREAVLGRRGMPVFDRPFEKTGQEVHGTAAVDKTSTPLDPCVYATIPLSVPPGEKRTLRFSLAVAPSRSDASSAAKRTLKRSGGSALPDETALRLELTHAERDEAAEWLARMAFPRPCAAPGDAEALALGREGLWQLGISGDLPLMLVPASDAAQLERASRAVRQHRFLSLCGFACDLAVLIRDGGDYRRPARSALMEVVKSCRAEHTAGRKNGIHFVDTDSLGDGQEALLRVFASVVLGEGGY